MPGSRSIARLLERHKVILAREMDNPKVIEQLVNKGVLTSEDEVKLRSQSGDAKADVIVEMFSQKGFNAFREMCVTLEMECPQLLTSLLLDSAGELMY